MDDFNRRGRFHPSGKLHELANVLLHENLRQILARTTGFDLSVPAFRGAARFTFIFLGFWQGLHLLLTWRRENWRWILARAVFFFVAVGYFLISVPGDDFLRPIFFPQDMLLYVMAGAVASLLYFLFHWRQRDSQGASGLILLSIFSSLLAFRILLDVTPWQYAIYYNGPVVLSFLLLLRPLIPQQGTDRRAVFLAELLICLGCVAVPALYTRRIVKISTGWVPLTTERGTIFARPVQVEQYRAAVRFMQEKGAKGEAVLSIPEDVSLYFFSETHCPTRVLAFTPGVLVPGKMTEDTIRQIEQKPVRYLVWSNRLFPEYGVASFGTDFDQTMGNYLRTHYHRAYMLAPDYFRISEWNAFVWERNDELRPSTIRPEGFAREKP